MIAETLISDLASSLDYSEAVPYNKECVRRSFPPQSIELFRCESCYDGMRDFLLMIQRGKVSNRYKF